MGSLFSPKVSAPPPPPPPPPPSTIRDEIAGVEQIPVKGADGSVTYVTKRIPLTPEQEAEQAEFKAIMQDALDEITRLSSSDFSEGDETKTILNAWEEERKKLLEDTFKEREVHEEQNLTRRGLGESTIARETKRRRRLDRQESLEQLQRERNLLSNDIRRQQLDLQQNLFNVASQRSDLDSARAQQSAASGIGRLISADAARQSSLLDYHLARSRQQTSAQNNPFLGVLGGSILGSSAGVPGILTGGLTGLFK